MAAALSVGATAVFEAGPHRVDAKLVDKQHVLPELPCSTLMVVTPTDAGSYPVAVFLHGFSMFNSWYESLLTHVSSHGFITVAPQFYGVTLNMNDIDATRQVAAWLSDERHGLSYVLNSVFNLRGIEPDLSRLALAGHSRGGDTAFAVALGLGGAGAPSEPKFSALIGVDPVAGLSKAMQVEPKVLTFKPRSLHMGMPVLVIGTGMGPEHVGGPPCAPAGVNHAEFYYECAPPRYHFVVKDYGHLDMMDDDVPYVVNCCCKRNLKDPKDLARRAMGGVMVAFLRAVLQHDDGDLNVVLANPGLAPAVLDPVQHDLA